LSGGWLGILGLGVDYFNGGGGPDQGMDSNVGYVRYGRAQFALRATYRITPAWAIYGAVAPTWSAEKVDADTACPALTVGNSQSGLHVEGRGFQRELCGNHAPISLSCFPPCRVIDPRSLS
jgi:hypothetical protein